MSTTYTSLGRTDLIVWNTRSSINPCRVEFISGNVKYRLFVSQFLNTDVPQVAKSLLVERRESLFYIFNIMAVGSKEPGHQKAWYLSHSPRIFRLQHQKEQEALSSFSYIYYIILYYTYKIITPLRYAVKCTIVPFLLWYADDKLYVQILRYLHKYGNQSLRDPHHLSLSTVVITVRFTRTR